MNGKNVKALKLDLKSLCELVPRSAERKTGREVGDEEPHRIRSYRPFIVALGLQVVSFHEEEMEIFPRPLVLKR